MDFAFHLKFGSQMVMQDLELHLDYVTIYASTNEKMQLKILFAVPFENCPKYYSI